MSRNLLAIRLWLILMIIASSLPGTPALAQSAVVVRVEPSALTAQVNDTIILPVKIDNIVDLSAFELHLAFNPSVLEVIQVTNGGFVAADFTAQNTFDNIAGTLDYAAAQMNRTPAQGSGALLNITFRAKSNGNSSVTLRATQAVQSGLLLSDSNGMALQASWVSGSVNVGSGSTPSPTPTITNTPIVTLPSATPTRTNTSVVTPLQNAVVVRVDPSATSAQVNDRVNLFVKVDNIANLAASELHLAFNPNVLEVIEVTNGGFVAADFVAQNTFDNVAGTLDYAVAQINRTPAQGSGTLLNIAFRAKANGNSSVTLRATQAVSSGLLLSDLNGMPIQASWVSGSVTVTAGPTPTITNTPTVTPPQNAVLVRVDASTTSVQVNDRFNLFIKVDNIANLAAIELHLTFNPGVLEVVDVTNGGFVAADYPIQKTFDNTAGTLDYAVAQLNRAPAQGSGTLLNIAFRAKAEGASTLTLRATQAVLSGLLLSDPNGGAILPISWKDGRVTVIAAQQARIHVVRWGEYLYCIARAYKVSPWAIADASGVWWPYMIFPNQKLTIPNDPWINMSAGAVCQPQFTTSIPASTPTAIPATAMPTATTIGAATATAWPTTVAATATTVPASTCRAYYTVRSGDTLYRIATMYGINYTDIARVNQIANPRLIYSGQRLCIP